MKLKHLIFLIFVVGIFAGLQVLDEVAGDWLKQQAQLAASIGGMQQFAFWAVEFGLVGVMAALCFIGPAVAVLGVFKKKFKNKFESALSVLRPQYLIPSLNFHLETSFRPPRFS